VAVYCGCVSHARESFSSGSSRASASHVVTSTTTAGLFMVSAGPAYNPAFGADRKSNPWQRHPQGAICSRGRATSGCSPITTSYICRCRDTDGKLIVVILRMTPIILPADLYLPVRPDGPRVADGDAAHHSRDGWEPAVHSRATSGFDDVAASTATYDPAQRANGLRRSPEASTGGAHVFAECGPRIALHARGLELTPGRGELLGAHHICLSTGHLGPRSVCAMITAMAMGNGGRDTCRVRSAAGPRRCSDTAREHVAPVWGITPDESLNPGSTPPRSWKRS